MWKPIILDVECIVCNKSLQKINHDPLDATRKMGKITCRRSRTPNWSVDEKKYLLELIKERKDVVIMKNNNGPHYSEDKDVAWNEILRELALKYGTKFSHSSTKKVKTQWQNMKRIAREEIALVGTDIGQFTQQTLEVCYLLDMIKDGVLLKPENENLNDTVSTVTANIEVKTERFDEDMNEPSCSGLSIISKSVPSTSTNKPIPTASVPVVSKPSATSTQPPSTDSSVSDTTIEFDMQEERVALPSRKSVSATTMTESPVDTDNLNPFHRQLQEFFKYTSDEKHLKMESLKEERRVARAMREAAELHKIIAEQKLKHVLWQKKQEMAMYAGEPGSGAGKGGGGGGAIREAGGAFGKMEAAREDEYFYKKQKEQLANLKGHLDKEIAFHQDQIKRHEDAIRRHKEQMSSMDKQ